MKSIIISTAIILAIGLGGAWAERALATLVAATHQASNSSPA